MKKVTAILDRKQSHFKTVSPLLTIRDALNKMNCENTDHLIVMDDDENFLGIITEHDIMSKSLSAKIPNSEMQVSQIMNTHFPVAFIEDSVQTCMQSMQQYHVRILPVFDGHVFKGVVTADDILYEAVWNHNEIFDEEKEIIAY
ncbi:MAG: CBS domain-containing protein [Bacteroidia bacterium]|nr:CBS domain-containing protein [Bacteroidia bacterium]